MSAFDALKSSVKTFGPMLFSRLALEGSQDELDFELDRWIATPGNLGAVADFLDTKGLRRVAARVRSIGITGGAP